jgi:hypothetical protein
VSGRTIDALRSLAERGATAGEREAAQRALDRLRNAHEPDVWVSGMAGRYRYDRAGRQAAEFDVPSKEVAHAFFKGEMVVVAVGRRSHACHVTGYILRPSWLDSTVLCRIVGPATGPVAAIGGSP